MSIDLMDMYFQPMREELTRFGFKELRTPDDVDAAMKDDDVTRLVVINSMCGCAGGIARPAAVRAVQEAPRPQELLTVFASQDREATARLRELLADYPPSSPSIALFKGRNVLHFIPRDRIESSEAETVKQELRDVFEKYCVDRPA